MAIDTRQRIIESAYACVAHRGIAKTTVEDVARRSGVSRATVYRTFPGGRDQLVDEVIAWAALQFFVALYEQVHGADTLEEVMELGIRFAHRSIVEHQVLQRVMQTEPDRLLPALTVESVHIREDIASFLGPYLAVRDLAPGADASEAADFLARMVLSYMSSPGRWDLDDPAQVAQLVRAELLAGVVVPGGPSGPAVPDAPGRI